MHGSTRRLSPNANHPGTRKGDLSCLKSTGLGLWPIVRISNAWRAARFHKSAGECPRLPSDSGQRWASLHTCRATRARASRRRASAFRGYPHPGEYREEIIPVLTLRRFAGFNDWMLCDLSRIKHTDVVSEELVLELKYAEWLEFDTSPRLQKTSDEKLVFLGSWWLQVNLQTWGCGPETFYQIDKITCPWQFLDIPLSFWRCNPEYIDPYESVGRRLWPTF